ncbi:MAG: TolC family outer membrane protein [Syntrophales bacterium]|nr:TolC family outer membrane protein [Syntrophales bacterium]
MRRDHSSVSASFTLIGPGAFALMLAMLFWLPAQSAQAEGILDVYKMALEKDASFIGAQFSHEASKETLTQAWAAFQPKISAEGKYTRTAQKIISSDNTVYGQGSSTFPTKEYSLSLVQPLFNKASLANLSRAKARLKGADMDMEVARQDLIVRIAKVYLGVLAARDRLALARTEEAAVGLHYELASEKFKMGLTPKTDYLDAKSRIAEIRANRIAAESATDDAHQALREVTGKLIVSLAALREDLPMKYPAPGNVEAWIDGAVQQNPSLEAQRQAVEAARREYERQCAGHYPLLNLEAGYTYNEADGTVFGGGSQVESTNVLLRLNIPLFEGGITNSRSREAYNLYQAALQEQERQLRALQKETRAAYSGVVNAMERVKALQEAVESRELALQAKQDGYKSGLFILLAVLDAQRDLSLTKQDYAMARYDYVMNSLRLKKAFGTLAERDIVAVQGWLADKQ